MLTLDCSRSAAIGRNEPANCGSRLLPKGSYLRDQAMLITAHLGGFQYPGRGNGRFRRAPCKGGAFQWVQGPPGASLQPEAIGAVMEVTKWLKPSISGHNW